MLKKIKNNRIEIFTFGIYIFAMIVFEIGYCNAANIIKLIQGNDVNYNFSLCRVVFYLVFLIVVFFVKKFFIEEALKVWKNRKKRVITYIYIIVMIITIIICSVIIAINPLYIRGLSIGIIAVLMGAIFIIYISNDITKNVIITIFSLGVVFSITTNFNHAIDEKKHFMSSFNIAFGNFNYTEKPITDKQIEELPQITKFSEIDHFFEGRYEANITQEVDMEDIPSTPASYSAITYFFSAIGILIAKTLGGSIIDIYIAGRFFNLILYCILTCVAIKLVPYKKNIFAIIFLLPISLTLAGTYSVDGYCIGMVAILISFCLKLKEEKKTISLKDFLVLVILFTLTLFAKSMAYVMVGFIFLLLPIKDTLKKNKKYIPIIIVCSILSVIIIGILALKIKDTKITSDSRAGSDISVSRQLEYIITNPLFDIKLAINQIKNTFLNLDWYKMLHEEKFFTVNAQAVLIPMILFILYVALTENDHNFKIKEKIIMITAFILVYGMTSMVLYLSFTPVGSLFIGGYQTRYIIPILALPLFCISSKNIQLKNIEYRNLKIAGISGFIIMLGIMQSIIV